MSGFVVDVPLARPTSGWGGVRYRGGVECVLPDSWGTAVRSDREVRRSAGPGWPSCPVGWRYQHEEEFALPAVIFVLMADGGVPVSVNIRSIAWRGSQKAPSRLDQLEQE